MSSTDSQENYIRLAHQILEYLRTRYHTEAPHISLLSPEYAIIPRIKLFTPHPTLEEYLDEGEGDFIPEALADLLDPTRIRGHATHGVKATFKKSSDDFEISMETVFYIRKAPPAEFKKVEVKAVLRKGKIDIEVIVKDEEDEKAYKQFSQSIELKRTQFSVIFAIGWRNIVKEAASIVSKMLYSGAKIIEFTGDDVVSALSTAENTKNGQKFLFYPSIGLNQYADSQNYFVVQNFLYEIEIIERNDEIEVTFILRYIAPVLLDRRRKFIKVSGELGFPTYAYIDNKRNRWSVHHLLEVESRLRWTNAEPAWEWQQKQKGREYAGLHNLTPIGALSVEDDFCKMKNNCLLLRDWHIEIERIYPIKGSKEAVDQVFYEIGEKLINYARTNGVRINEEALKKSLDISVKALRKAFPNIKQLYEFQEQALYEGLKALLKGEHRAFVLQTRTAGGKTLAFLLPIVVYITYSKLSGNYREGVKALLFYPTTALQNDQAATIFKLLWHVNLILSQEKLGVISLGMLHGHTPRRGEPTHEEKELRLSCPLCGQRLIISWKPIENTKIHRESIKCNNPSCQIYNSESPESKLLQGMIKGSRDAIYSSPPDLLIVNPDIINARLTLMGREDPASLTILGKHAYICKRCGQIYDRKNPPRKCIRCDANTFYSARFTYPEIIVVDEAHLLRGAFGAQVSHVFTRLEQAIRMINNPPKNWKPVYFVSSATLNNPKERTRELIATDPNRITIISAEREESKDVQTLRIHVFIMPKLYSPEATTARIAEAVYQEVSALVESRKELFNKELTQLRNSLFNERNPATLIFVNRIAEANELLGFIRSFAPNINSDGHTTDYQADRVRVEDEFSRGNLDVIVATSGLEVGVDFDRVDIGIIYGMPFYISDYTQRIGRIGRRQHCIIFNVFMPDKPIDHFYYKNWKLLSDGTLRDIHMRAEAYRINRENPEAVRRASQRAVLDMLSTKPGAYEILDQSIMAQNQRYKHDIIKFLDSLESEVESELQHALGISNVDEAIKIAKQFIDKIKENAEVHGTLINAIRKGFESSLRQLHSLRSLETEVKYKFNPINEERGRDMIYAFRHALPGQIISYRGTFYSVNSFNGEPINFSLEGG